MGWRKAWNWCSGYISNGLSAMGGGDWPSLPQSIGRRGERLAIRHLKSLGYTIIAWSDRGRLGEIDIVAVDGSTVVFVEVKTRRNAAKGNPADAVDNKKEQQLTRVGYAFLHSHNLLECAARFDVIAIIWPAGKLPQLRHYKNAFDAVGKGYVFY
ncbi:MAG: putative endonuclease [Pirellulaceae bacterium]|jgi:putative endonuclease